MKVEFNVPKELEEEIKSLSDIEKTLFLTRLIEEKLQKLSRLKQIVAKSQLTEEDVKELSERVDKALSKRFMQSIKE